MEPGLTNLMAKSRDYDTLVAAWKGWRDATGKKMKDLYAEFVELRNEGARMSGRKYFCCIHIIIFSLSWYQLSVVVCQLCFHILLQVNDKSSCEPLGYFYKWLANNLWNHCTYMQQENIWFKKKRFKCLICHATLTLIWYTLI